MYYNKFRLFQISKLFADEENREVLIDDDGNKLKCNVDKSKAVLLASVLLSLFPVDFVRIFS